MSHEREMLIAEALQALETAGERLGQVGDMLESEALREPPGGEKERLALGARRATAHLVEAAADLPGELWAVLKGGQT